MTRVTAAVILLPHSHKPFFLLHLITCRHSVLQLNTFWTRASVKTIAENVRPRWLKRNASSLMQWTWWGHSEMMWPVKIPVVQQWFGISIIHHGSCPDVKIKFKDFARTFKDHMKDIHRRTTWTKNSTLISISKQVKFTFDNLRL